MGFPPHNAEIITNEEGEPLGWDIPGDPMDYYCHDCGFAHAGSCAEPSDPDEEDEECE